MRHILTITLSALTLAGCADTYDKADTYNRSAMLEASASLQQQAAGCTTKWTAREFKTYSEWQACQLTADRSFARAIALKKMDAFEAYAADMQALAADRDAHRVTVRQGMMRAKEIRGRFLADCGCKPQRPPFGGYVGNTAGQDWAGASSAFDASPRGRELSGT